jgi:F0F1-type ATP synthase assembly protein I
VVGEVRGVKDLQLLGRLGMLLTIPAVLAAGPLLGYFAGNFVHQRWQSGPWTMAAGIVIGGAGSCIEVYRILRWVRRFDRNKSGK